MYTALRSPRSFGGVNYLRRYGGLTTPEARQFLSKYDAYTLHQLRRLRFPQRRKFSKGIADLYQINLVDLSSYAYFNDGMRYLLTRIDVFSKRTWTVPIRIKSARIVADALEKILADGKCNMLQSDKRTEFLNSTFQNTLKRHDIKFYTSENEDLSSERFNRTLKMEMYTL